MRPTEHSLFPSDRYCITFLLLLMLIFLIYSNTFHASWHFDDNNNILQNPNLHIEDLQPDSIIQTFYAPDEYGFYRDGRIYRPIPCLTFAINWYLGKENVVGYHIVNIIIHLLTSWILFLTILNLSVSPNLKNRYQEYDRYFISLLAAVLWGINPIQTQAVTYIVQRMATMAAMFYILALYFYIKGRITSSYLKQIIFFGGCLLSFLSAVGSKENTITLPVALLLVEIIFFQDISIQKTRKIFLWTTIITALLSVFLGTLFFILFMEGNPVDFIFNSYNNRPPVIERLMTQPGILIFYLTQIFYPVPNRLSVQHDVIISTSLFEPLTTIPSFIMIFTLIVTGLFLIRRSPVAAFSILFFFLNHLIESTAIPLEPIFEHRNYLPSLFLFFPVSTGLKWLMDYYFKKEKPVYWILTVFITFLFIGFGMGTYIRNMAWATDKTLWEDAAEKAPNSSRPYHNLAVYYGKIKNFDKAIELYERSLLVRYSKLNDSGLLSLKNMGNIFLERGEYIRAVRLFKDALNINSEDRDARYSLVLSLVSIGNMEEALENISLLLSKYNDTNYLSIKGVILLRQQKPEEAMVFFRDFFKSEPDSWKALTGMGVCFSFLGEYKQADFYLKRARLIFPDNFLINFCLIENRLKMGDISNAELLVERLISVFNIREIENNLIKISNDRISLPVTRELIAPLIAEKLREKAEEIAKSVEKSE